MTNALNASGVSADDFDVEVRVDENEMVTISVTDTVPDATGLGEVDQHHHLVVSMDEARAIAISLIDVLR